MKRTPYSRREAKSAFDQLMGISGPNGMLLLPGCKSPTQTQSEATKKQKPSRNLQKSSIETELHLQIRAAKLPNAERELKFHPVRLWRFDFAWPEQKLAVECEGGLYTGGRHTRGSGFEKDCEKYNEATLHGWRVLRFSGAMVKKGEALRVIERALA